MCARRFAFSTLVAAVGQLATAQVAHKILNVGESRPAGGPALTQLLNVATNDVGGFVIHGRAAAPAGYVAWGRQDLLASQQTLFKQGDYSGLEQDSWMWTGISLDASGAVGYVARLEPGDTLSVWRNDVPVAIEGQASSVPGLAWHDLRYPHLISATGEPYYYAVLSSDGVSHDLGGLFLGDSPLFLGGDVLPGLPLALADTPLYLDRFDLSETGNHWAAVVWLTDGSQALLVDGAALEIEGAPVITGQPLPASWGAGSWTSLRNPQVNTAGDLAFDGVTSAGNLLVKNGARLHAAGDVVDGLVASDFRGPALSPSGQLAFYVLSQAGDWALAVDDTVLLRTGDEVDLDGDGLLDAGTHATPYTPANPATEPAIGVDGRVYCLLRVDTLGTPADFSDDTLGAYQLGFDAAGPNSYCTSTLSSAGCLAQMSSVNAPSERAIFPFALRAMPVSAGSIGALCYGLSGPAALPLGGGTLCIQPPVRRRPPVLPLSLGAGSCNASLSVEFNALIQSGNDSALVAGADVCVQWVYRDNAAPGGMGFSNALRFEIQP